MERPGPYIHVVLSFLCCGDKVIVIFKAGTQVGVVNEDYSRLLDGFLGDLACYGDAVAHFLLDIDK